MKKRGQVAIEYLAIVGFALLLMFPLIFIYMSESQDYEDRVLESQIRAIGRELVDAAETVNYLGPPSKTTIKVYVPSEVKSITFNSTFNEIQFDVVGFNGITGTNDIYEYSRVNITGPQIVGRTGILYFQVQAIQNGVNITQS